MKYKIIKMEQVQNDIMKLADHLYEWCEAIDDKGGAWDYWDDFYKDAYWRDNNEIYKLVRKYMTPREDKEND